MLVSSAAMHHRSRHIACSASALRMLRFCISRVSH